MKIQIDRAIKILESIDNKIIDAMVSDLDSMSEYYGDTRLMDIATVLKYNAMKMNEIHNILKVTKNS